jgi:type VI secretion system protein ImpH
MAGTERRKEPAVVDQLRSEAFQFAYYQAVRLLHMLRPGSVPLGQGSDPTQEAVRLRAAISLAFPASDVAGLRDGTPPELVVNFMSLAGIHGPLPHPVTEHLLERIYRKDTAFRDFLDLFHHRLLSLFFRVHSAHRVGIETGPPETHAFASYLYALLGLGTGGLRGRMAIPDRALLRYAGLLNKSPRDAAGLTALLQDYFGVPVRCEPLVGAFRPLDASQCSSLGETGQNRRLGIDTMLGGSVWDQHAGIELLLGPLPYAQYQEFLPGGSRCIALCELVRFYLGPGLDVRVRALVQGMERPALQLSSKRQDGSRLGWNAWLQGRSKREESAEVALFELMQFQTQPAMPEVPSAPARPANTNDATRGA